MKRIGIVLSLLALLVVGVGAASAQDVEQQGRDGRRGPTERQIVQTVIREVGQVITAETGLTTEEVMAQLQEGSTLAGVVEGAGANVDAVSAAVVASMTTRIEQAVADEQLPQQAADRLLENLDSLVERAMNAQPGQLREVLRDRDRGRQTMPNVGNILNLIAEETGMSRAELVQAWRDGTSMAQILTDAGVEVDGFVDQIIVGVEIRLAPAVENGRISQEDLDTRLTQVRERLTEMLNRTEPVRGSA